MIEKNKTHFLLCSLGAIVFFITWLLSLIIFNAGEIVLVFCILLIPPIIFVANVWTNRSTKNYSTKLFIAQEISMGIVLVLFYFIVKFLLSIMAHVL